MSIEFNRFSNCMQPCKHYLHKIQTYIRYRLFPLLQKVSICPLSSNHLVISIARDKICLSTHVNGITKHILFHVWLLLCSSCFWDVIAVCSFVLLYFITRTDDHLFVHSLINRNLGCFQSFPIITKRATIIFVQIILCTNLFMFFVLSLILLATEWVYVKLLK